MPLSRLLLRLCLLVIAPYSICAGFALLVGHSLPPAQRIAYVAGEATQIYSVRLVDVERRLNVPFARYPARVSAPVWSPDGGSLMYRVYYPYVHMLAIADLHTGEELYLENGTAYASLPAWSPDGERVAFVTNRANGRFLLYTHDLNSGGIDRLTDAAVYDHTPVWTADGSQILFSAWRTAEGVSAVGLESGNEHRLVEDLDFMNEVSWSPDRARFVYPVLMTATARPYVALFMVEFSQNPAESLPQLLIDGAYNNYEISWAPDSQQIAFASTRDGNREIYIMNVHDRASVRRLTDHPASDARPVWSPDGESIAFFSDRDGGDLYRVYVATGHIERLTFGAGYPAGFAWQPTR